MLLDEKFAAYASSSTKSQKPAPAALQEDFTIRIAAGQNPDEVVVDMRTRSRGEGGLDGNTRITSFLAELQEVRCA